MCRDSRAPEAAADTSRVVEHRPDGGLEAGTVGPGRRGGCLDAAVRERGWQIDDRDEDELGVWLVGASEQGPREVADPSGNGIIDVFEFMPRRRSQVGVQEVGPAEGGQEHGIIGTVDAEVEHRKRGLDDRLEGVVGECRQSGVL